MDNSTISKEEIALELSLKFLDKTLPKIDNYSPESVGKMLAALFNAVLEDLKV